MRGFWLNSNLVKNIQFYLSSSTNDSSRWHGSAYFKNHEYSAIKLVSLSGSGQGTYHTGTPNNGNGSEGTPMIIGTEYDVSSMTDFTISAVPYNNGTVSCCFELIP